jgi:hypothetical protein
VKVGPEGISNRAAYVFSRYRMKMSPSSTNFKDLTSFGRRAAIKVGNKPQTSHQGKTPHVKAIQVIVIANTQLRDMLVDAARMDAIRRR